MAPEKSKSKPTKRLGRGLDALFNASPTEEESLQEPTALRDIRIADISSNPFQPRKHFAEPELRELEESLKAAGLLQPITVRPAPGRNNHFELIAGERRLRAATNIGWKQIAAVVKDLTDQEILTLALVENLQRADLNPVEEAEGYDQLIKDFGYTQQTVATMVGKDRSTIANVLRVLQLPEPVRQLLRENLISAGHARPLLGLANHDSMLALANEIVSKGLSAREVERRVRETGTEEAKPVRRGRPRNADSRSPELKDIEESFRKYLQTDVSISLKSADRGTLTISFYSADDLERIGDLIGVTRNPQ